MTTSTESHRCEIFQRLFDRWGETFHPLNPNSSEEIDSAERQLGTLFPRSLVEFLSTYGGLSIKIDLLNIVVEQGINLQVPADFLRCLNIIKDTEGWVRAGMPSDLIAFATSATGNMFCVRRVAGGPESRPDDVPIWHFDHEYVEVEQVAPSLVDWLSVFVNIGAS